jgi:hypothetical protein
MPAEGGAAVQVTLGGGWARKESWDGRHLYYYLSTDRSGIWRAPVGGGEETEVVRGPVDGNRGFDLSPTGLYYATEREGIAGRTSVYTISFLDFESGQVTELFRREGPFFTFHGDLAVSPDEEWILYGDMPGATSELMLVENFR